MSSGPENTTVIALPSAALSLSILHQGLHIHRLLLTEIGTTGGKTHDLVPGPEEWSGERAFQHCIVGRYANRLPARSISLPSGATVTPTSWPDADNGVCLHGGPDSWDQRIFTPVTLASTKLFSSSEKASIEGAMATPQYQLFELISPDGDGGFPGQVRCEVLIGLVEEKSGAGGNVGSVVVVYRAALEEGGKETPINLTQHWGFNLDASLGGPSPSPEAANVRGHSLTLQSSNRLDLDPESSLPTGKLSPSPDGDEHDHRSGKKIGDRYPSKGYDDFYVFDQQTATDASPSTFSAGDLSKESTDFVTAVLSSSPPSPTVAVLSSELSGITLSFQTNQAGVQCYTSPGGGGSDRKLIHGGGESGYTSENACYLEFHAPYAGFVVPGLQDALEKNAGGKMFDTLLREGEVYNNFARLNVQIR